MYRGISVIAIVPVLDEEGKIEEVLRRIPKPLVDETLVVVTSEMGRTPRGTAQWGRGHWSFCYPTLLAGAGVRGGIAYGRSDKDAGYPVERPVSPEDLACTIFDALGIDPHSIMHDKQNRPVALVEGGRVLGELFG